MRIQIYCKATSMKNKETNRKAVCWNKVTGPSQERGRSLAPVGERELHAPVQRLKLLRAPQWMRTPPTRMVSMRRPRRPAPKALAVTVWPSESSRTVEEANQVLRPSARETTPEAIMAVSHSTRDNLYQEVIKTLRFRRLPISG